jgi:hypothetical protein
VKISQKASINFDKSDLGPKRAKLGPNLDLGPIYKQILMMPGDKKVDSTKTAADTSNYL